jgi:transketolase
MINKLLEHSYNKQLTHVPSALSMLTYVRTLFKNEFIKPYRDRIVLGKPFGSQAYYLIWKEFGYLDDIEGLSMGVKHNEIEFVDYSEETMGNALGVAAGMAMANPDQRVWVNLTDATLQMGSTLEAIQFIGHHQLKNITLSVDYNNCQVTGSTSDIIPVKPVINFFRECRWDVIECDGHNETEIRESFYERFDAFPCAFIYKTIKGFGVGYMEKDPVKWHYRPMETV